MKRKFLNLINFSLSLVLILSLFLMTNISSESVVSVSNSEYNGTIYAGDKNQNKICLMINVYWGNDSLIKILEILKRNEVKTTFFVGGMWAKENENLLLQIKDDGHEIANHGYSHKEHKILSYSDNMSEIEKCHEIVKYITGLNMSLFAPPGGSYSKLTTSSASFLGYKTIMWTRDTIDWRDHNSSLIYNRAVTNMQGGDLILMHPTENTAEALQNIISFAKNHGFELTTVSDTLNFN